VRARQLVAVVGVLVTCAVAPSAHAVGVKFRFTFGQARAGVPTTGHVHVVFPTDDQGRPRQLSGLDFQFPRGTVIDRTVAPVCTATDDDIDTLGADACPPAAQVGWGSATANTGFGPPVDPFSSDAHTFNTPTGTVNVFTPHGSRRPAVWRTRQRYDRLWVRDSFPPPPSGFPPPDGKSLPLEAEFTLDRRAGRRAWLTTPRRCPARGAWRAHAVLTFADGGGETASATTPCRRRRSRRCRSAGTGAGEATKHAARRHCPGSRRR
jgi:hypothetical protein